MTLEDRVRELLDGYRDNVERAQKQHDDLYATGAFKAADGFRVIAGWHRRFVNDLERILDGTP